MSQNSSETTTTTKLCLAVKTYIILQSLTLQWKLPFYISYYKFYVIVDIQFCGFSN